MPLLEAAIGDNRQQWAEVAASLHAARGIPRPTVAELFSTKPETPPKAGPLQGNLPLLQAALRKLQPSTETDDLLIRAWIANAPFNACGSANSLVEYADSPVTTETLRQALRNDLRGSSYIAMVLANHGNKAIVPDAVARAFRVTDDPTGLGVDFNEVQGAAALLRDQGSDQELTRLAAIVRKYQTLDAKYYGVGGDDRRHDMNHSEALETQAKSVEIRERRWNGDASRNTGTHLALRDEPESLPMPINGLRSRASTGHGSGGPQRKGSTRTNMTR
jgi:hypothetical protein